MEYRGKEFQNCRPLNKLQLVDGDSHLDNVTDDRVTSLSLLYTRTAKQSDFRSSAVLLRNLPYLV